MLRTRTEACEENARSSVICDGNSAVRIGSDWGTLGFAKTLAVIARRKQMASAMVDEVAPGHPSNPFVIFIY